MDTLRNCVVVMLLMIVSTNAAIIREDKAPVTEIERSDHQLDSRMAKQAFLKLSTPCPQHGVIQMCSAGQDFTANQMIDMILEFARNLIVEKNMDYVDIPPFQEDKLTGKGGWFGRTTTISRRGQATVSIDDNKVLLRSSVGLDTMKLKMYYSVPLLSGSVEAEVKGNAVSFSGGLVYSGGKCRIFLDRLKITDLSDIEMWHTTSGGPLFNWIAKKVTLNNLERIKTTVESEVQDAFGRELENLECPPFLTTP